MKTDVYQKITDQIVSALEKGVRPWHQPWKAEHAAERITRGAAPQGAALSLSSPKEISAMNTYRVYFRSDLQWGMREIVADTAAQALALARRLADENPEDLDLDYYEGCDSPINEIEVCDNEHNQVDLWYDDDMLLRLAASDLLEALEAVCDIPADDAGERTIPAGFLDQARAAIAKAQEGAA